MPNEASAGATRLARPEDVPALVRIRAAVRENRLSDPARVPASLVLRYIERGLIHVLDEGGSVLGFSAAEPDDGTIWALFVDPDAEGRGIARALLPLALDDLKRAGWSEARLTTQPGSRAERFYRLAGWTALGISAAGERIFVRSL